MLENEKARQLVKIRKSTLALDVGPLEFGDPPFGVRHGARFRGVEVLGVADLPLFLPAGFPFGSFFFVVLLLVLLFLLAFAFGTTVAFVRMCK